MTLVAMIHSVTVEQRMLSRIFDLDAVLFDLDGVLTSTAELHEAAWKATFDGVLREVTPAAHPWKPFDHLEYRRHVDGRTRLQALSAIHPGN
jgi:beta-phosphoglucomutase-like phosphatase (HAD superfamily)